MFIIYSMMEELVTLQYRNFIILREQAKEFAQRLFQLSCWLDPQGSTFSQWVEMRMPELDYWPKTRVRSLSVGVPAPQCSLHEEKRVPKVLQSTAGWDSQRNGLWAALCLDPFRTNRCGDIKDCQTSLQGECVVVPSVLPHQQQEEYIRELCQELAKCIGRAGLQSAPRPARLTSRSSGCFHGHAASKAQSPLSRPQWAELANWPREDPLTGQLGSRRQHSHSMDRDMLR